MNDTRTLTVIEWKQWNESFVRKPNWYEKIWNYYIDKSPVLWFVYHKYVQWKIYRLFYWIYKPFKNRVFVETIDNELVSVRPMDGPIGLIFYLDLKENK